MSEYKKQAEKFLKDTETTFKAEFLRHGVHFEGDTEERDIYEITLTKDNRVYKFDFGQSIAHSGRYILNNGKLTDKKPMGRMYGSWGITHKKNKEFKGPEAYDVLACLDVFDEDFEEFCACFGYEEDSRTALKIFEKVEEQTKQLKIIWDSSDIEKLQEIN